MQADLEHPTLTPPQQAADAATEITSVPASPTPQTTPAAAPIVDCRDLTKVFKDFWGRARVRALDRLSFQVYPGEVFGLLGPNGSGKSTAIKILLGLLFPSAGSLRVFGGSPRETRHRGRMGYMPEDSPLYHDLTAAETLDFYARLFDLNTIQRRQRIDQLLHMIGLAHARRRRVGDFSRGMQRRIGLAQALLNDPDLVVLDEPTAGLDPLGCRDVKQLIRTLAERGKTVLLTSHLLADVENVCDRVAILYHGRSRCDGRVDQLLRRTDRLHISLKSRTPDDGDRLRAMIREITGEDPEIRHPAMDLESFFLDVIESARQKDGATSETGAAQSRGIAEYLARKPSASSRDILDRLVNPDS